MCRVESDDGSSTGVGDPPVSRYTQRRGRVCADARRTHGELEARANRRARLFASSGVKAGDFVTIALPNGNEFYETTFAVCKLGATPNPVPSKLPRTEFSAIIDLVKPSLVVGGEEQAVIGFNRLPAEADASSFSSEPGDEPLAPSWKAMTSGGSTGRPKVIVDRAGGMLSGLALKPFVCRLDYAVEVVRRLGVMI